MKSWIKLIAVVLGITLSLFVSYNLWRVEKWLNWKFSYGPQVEERIQDQARRLDKLEDQVRRLEKRLDIIENITHKKP